MVPRSSLLSIRSVHRMTSADLYQPSLVHVDRVTPLCLEGQSGSRRFLQKTWYCYSLLWRSDTICSCTCLGRDPTSQLCTFCYSREAREDSWANRDTWASFNQVASSEGYYCCDVGISYHPSKYAVDSFLYRTSSKATRMKEFLDTEEVPELTIAEIQAIEDAGSKMHKRHYWPNEIKDGE